MSKEFNFFGTAVKKGSFEIRGAVEYSSRVKVLEKDGQTQITLVELPHPMAKLDACKFILPLPEFQTVEQQTVIKNYIDKHDELYLPLEPVALATTSAVPYTFIEVPATEEVPAESNDEDVVIDTVYDNKIVDIDDELETFDDIEDYGFSNYAE